MTRSSPNPKLEAFFRDEEKWREEFKQLRAIILGCGLAEDRKWGKPCYAADGANIVIIQGFKEYCALLFFKGVLLKDPSRLMVQQTENVQVVRQIRFTSVGEISKLKKILKAYVQEAVAVEKSGVKLRLKKTADFKVPVEFQRILDEDRALKAAYETLTPGRQRGYLFYFSSAKQSETRAARVAKHRPRILQGKGLED